MAMFEICVETGPTGNDHFVEYQRAATLDEAIHRMGKKVNTGLYGWYGDRWMISEGACREVNVKTDVLYLDWVAYNKRVKAIQAAK
jgi:hypothetical protein